MTANILDHTQDVTGSEKYRLTNIYSPPEFVKAASAEQLYGDPETLPSHVYADPAKRLFPVHTAAATWMSTLFFMDKRAALDSARAARIEANINKTAKYFGIAGDVAKLKEAMLKDEGNDLARLPDEQFALVFSSKEGKERLYPLRNRFEVKAASEWFAQHRDKFAYADRRQIASKILERSEETGAAVADRVGLSKTAGRGMSGTQDIVAMLEKRAGLVANSFADFAGVLREMAQGLRERSLPVGDSETRLKLAETIDQLDRHTKLTRLYGDGGLERPEEVLFQVNEKQASEFLQDHISTTTGNIYQKEALAKLTLPQIQQWMGSELAEAVSAGGLLVDTEKLADVVTTLPRGDAAMFDRMAQATGIKPFAVEKEAAAQGPAPEEVEALADLYPQMAAAAIPL